MLSGPPGDLALVGKTLRSLERNVLMAKGGLFDMIGKSFYTYHRLYAELSMLNRKIYCFGAADEKAEGKIRGMTLAGALCDEVTLYPESFVTQLLARCSVESSQLFWNCNPDSPFHYIKERYIDNPDLRDLIKTFHFLMDDNPALDEKYKADLARLYTGIWKKRLIEGLWVMADGVIYPEWDPEKMCVNEAPDRLSHFHYGVDYGITNPQVYLMTGERMEKNPKTGKEELHLYVMKEYYKAGGEGIMKTDDNMAEDYVDFAGRYLLNRTRVDPSATSFKNALKKRGVNAMDAKNDVKMGIANVSSWIGSGRLHVVKPNCPNLLKEFSTYTWDARAQKQGKDEPLKESDHCMDALRYIINSDYPIFNATGQAMLPGGPSRPSKWRSAE